MRNFRLSSVARWGALCSFLLGFAVTANAQNYVQASFTQVTQMVPESGNITSGTTVNRTINVAVQLSRASAFEIVVPVILEASSTAKLFVEEGDGGDYALPTEENFPEGITWNAETQTFLFTFAPGSGTTLSLPILILNDDAVEGPETIELRIDEPNVTVARPVRPLQHTITIQDDDPISVEFVSESVTVREGDTASFGLQLSTLPHESLVAKFEIVYGSATADDIAQSTIPDNAEVTFGVTNRTGTISFRVLDDIKVEPEVESLQVRLVSLTFSDGATLPVEGIEPVTLYIYDDDPTEANIVYSADRDGDRQVELLEAGTLSFSINLSSPPNGVVRIPLNISGTATRGENEDSAGADYWLTGQDNFSEVVFGATNDEQTTFASSVTINLNLIDDRAEEGDETIIISLGTPVTSDDSEILLGDAPDLTFTIADNDPVRLSFGKTNLAAADDDSEPANLPASSGIAAESDGQYTIPVILSDRHGSSTAFRVEIVEDGTTATLYNPSGPDDQDWDFYVQLANGTPLTSFGTSRQATIAAGLLTSDVFVVFNNDTESDWIYGEAKPADVEEDETIHLRLTEVNTDESGVTFNGDETFPVSTDFILTVKDLPDIDVTALFTGRDPLTTNPTRNAFTSLHELRYAFGAPDGLNPADFAGYRSYKIVFPTGRFDGENLDAESNDPVQAIATGTADRYYYAVVPPFRPRYAESRKSRLILEGEPVSGNRPFTDENASYYFLNDYFLRELNLPVLDPEKTPAREDYYELPEDFDFFVEFTNGGRSTFQMDRVQGDHAVRFYLSRNSIPAVSGTVLPSNRIRRMIEQEDGSILFEVEVPIDSGASRQTITVEYMDEDGVWRQAQPTFLQNLNSRLYWIDHGYPRTESHPSDAPMRLYRFSSN
jgi:hypothetical protein